jgi:hypothetical protein
MSKGAICRKFGKQSTVTKPGSETGSNRLAKSESNIVYSTDDMRLIRILSRTASGATVTVSTKLSQSVIIEATRCKLEEMFAFGQDSHVTGITYEP